MSSSSVAGFSDPVDEYFCVGEDIFLNGPREGDEQTYCEIFEDGRVASTLLVVPHPYTIEDARWWVNYTMEDFRKTGIRNNFAIRSRSCGGKVIGGISINNIDDVSGAAEIGYWLSVPYWGKGIMPRIVSAFADFVSEQKSRHGRYANIAYLQAEVFANNERSCRVLEKAGFTFDRHLPKAYNKAGVGDIDGVRYVSRRFV